MTKITNSRGRLPKVAIRQLFELASTFGAFGIEIQPNGIVTIRLKEYHRAALARRGFDIDGPLTEPDDFDVSEAFE